MRASSSWRGSAALPRCHGRWRTTDCNHFVRNGEDVDGNAQPRPKLLPGAKPFRLAVKDNIATAGFPTQCASRILADHVSPYEATIMGQMRERGATVIGKTNMDEFGMGSHSTNSMHGPVLNPLSPDPKNPVSAGGSSGGSAVAVAVGDADVALGTDTGGSIRLPAAYNGMCGHRPSYGTLSRHGVIPYAHSLDTVGIIARHPRTILDLLLLDDLDLQHDPKDPTSLSAASRRRCAAARPSELLANEQVTVGIPNQYNIEELDPAIRAAWSTAIAVLEAAGFRVVIVSLPTTLQALSAYYILAAAEACSNLAKYDGVRYGAKDLVDQGSAVPDDEEATRALYTRVRGAGFGDEVKRRILLGTFSLSSEAKDNYFHQAQRVRRLICRDFDRVFRLNCPIRPPLPIDLSDLPRGVKLADRHGPPQVDFLLTPTTPSLPPSLSDVMDDDGINAYTNDVFTVPASLAGLPAVSLPVRTGSNGLPAGLQLIGQYWDDRRLLAMAERLMKLLE